MKRGWLVAMGLVFLLGALAQVRSWAYERAFWHDELYITYNLQRKPYSGMVEPLYWNQIAPPGWLIGERAILRHLGSAEQWLRLPQLLAAILVLGLTAYLAYRLLGPWPAVLATALAAGSPMLLYYAGELKQYAVETAVCAAVLLATYLYGERLLARTARLRDHAGYAVVGVLAMVGSYTALVVLGGALSGLLCLLLLRRRWTALLPAIGLALPGLLLGAAQAVARRNQGLLLDQERYFRDGLPPKGGGAWDVVTWLPSLWAAFIDSPISWQWPLVGLLVAALGLAALAWRGQALPAAILAGVFVAAVGASVVGGLPMVERAALYLLPPLILAVVAGVDGLARLARETWRRRPSVGSRTLTIGVATVLAAVLSIAVAPAFAGAVRQTRQPLMAAPYQEFQPEREFDNGRAMLQEIADRWQPGDVLLAYLYTEPFVGWYAPRLGLSVAGYVTAVAGPAGCAAPDLDFPGVRRIWFVYLELLSFHPEDLPERVLSRLTTQGSIVDSHVYSAAIGRPPAWVLVDRTRGPDPSPPVFTPVESPYGCLSLKRL